VPRPSIGWRASASPPERRIDDYPFRLSGGQKQRVMIAMTLAAEPDYLIADEPTTALDVTIQAQILDLLKRPAARAPAGRAADHPRPGRRQRHGAPRRADVCRSDHRSGAGGRVLRAPKHPYARLLLQALPDVARRGEPLAAIAGTVPPLWLDFAGCRFAPRCDRAMGHCATTLPALTGEGPRHQVRCLLYSQPGEALPREPAIASEMNAAPRGQGKPLLDVRDLCVRFALKAPLFHRGPRHFDAVDGVSFQLHAGHTLALVGESGCGKTTSGKAIVQLLRRQARISGQALFEGQDLFKLSGAALLKARRQIQIIFQDPFASLNPRMRVADVLEEGLIALRPDLDAAARRERLHTLVDQVGLRRDALQRWPHEFSGGQRQRIAIARALAVEPRLIVCDEPTSALDVSVQAQILNLLRELQRERGLAYLFITHNIGVVEYIADEVAVMQAGRVVERGRCDEILRQPTASFTQALLKAVPRLVSGPSRQDNG
jgi:peptide/nickel transport system ATP-binding protein